MNQRFPFRHSETTATSHEVSLRQVHRLVECISVNDKKGSPEGSYYAETGEEAPTQKLQTGEPNECRSLYRIRRTQETHQLLYQDCRQDDCARRSAAGSARPTSGRAAQLPFWYGAMEATLFSGWIYDTLKPYTAQLEMAHPAMLKAIVAGKKKNDRIELQHADITSDSQRRPQAHIRKARTTFWRMGSTLGRKPKAVKMFRFPFLVSRAGSVRSRSYATLPLCPLLIFGSLKPSTLAAQTPRPPIIVWIKCSLD